MSKAQAPRSQPLIAVSDVLASSHWYADFLNLTLLSNTHEDTHGNSYNRLLKGKKLILQLHGWDTDDHPNLTDRDRAPVGHGVVLWFEVDDFHECVSRAKNVGAEIITEPERNPFALHYEFWLRDLDGYVVGIASKPENLPIKLRLDLQTESDLIETDGPNSANCDPCNATRTPPSNVSVQSRSEIL